MSTKPQERRGIWRILIAAVALTLSLALGGVAQACPTCGAGMGDGGEAAQKMLDGWFWSIVFMMSMPFAIVSSLGGYMYWIVRRARRAAGDNGESIRSSACEAPPQSTSGRSGVTPAATS